jgi:hypothetical protein
MAIKLSDLSKDTRTIPVEYEGAEFDITYKPSAYTPETESAMQACFENNRPGNGLAEMLTDLLVWWDVEDEKGKNISPTLETLQKTPVPVLTTISGAITDDLRGERETRKNSGGGSRRKAS